MVVVGVFMGEHEERPSHGQGTSPGREIFLESFCLFGISPLHVLVTSINGANLREKSHSRREPDVFGG